MLKSVGLKNAQKGAPVKRTRSWRYRMNVRSMIIYTTICIVIAVLMFVLTLGYTRALKGMVEKESFEYLREVSAQMSAQLKNEISNHYSILRSYGSMVTQREDSPMQSILQDINSDQNIYFYHEVALIGSDGTIYGLDANVVFDNFDYSPYFEEVAMIKQACVTNLFTYEMKDCVAFAVPIAGTNFAEKTIVGVMGIADIETLRSSLTLASFNSQGYAHLINAKGDVIIPSDNRTSLVTQSNIFQFLANVDFVKKTKKEQIQENLTKRKTGELRYVRSDKLDVMAIYTPIGVRDWYLYSVIPTEALNSRTDAFTQLTLISCEVLSVVIVALTVLLFFLMYRNKKNIAVMHYTDKVIDGRSLNKFEVDTNKILRSGSNGFTMVYSNISRFKFINEQIGRENANALLKAIYEIIDADCADNETVTRVMADHFGILLATVNTDKLKERMIQWDKKISAFAIARKWGIIQMTYGVYFIEEPQDVTLMLDKANFARRTIDLSLTKIPMLAYYDSIIKEKVDFEKHLESRQEEALENGEFRMYLQPKYNPVNDTIAGAEALVRWLPDQGTVYYPDQYIPVFEANGFIVKMDLFIFEEACKFIRSFIDAGKEPLPVSVNLSRVNLNYPDFLKEYLAIWLKYDFDSSLIEFEITESLICQNMQYMRHVISEIHKFGFKVSMDDFGSSYSSLNMLKSVNIDVLKIDKRFFDDTKDVESRAETIIEHVIGLAKDLGLVVVSEGVENKEQADFLKEMKCDLIQGYYYAKPMSVADFLQLYNGNKKD